jgi:hypothetical protein
VGQIERQGNHGTLIEGAILSTVDLLITMACFVKRKIYFSVYKAADLS